MMSAEAVAHHILHAIEKRKRTLVLTKTGKLMAFLNKIWPTFTDKLVYNQMASEPHSPFSK